MYENIYWNSLNILWETSLLSSLPVGEELNGQVWEEGLL